MRELKQVLTKKSPSTDERLSEHLPIATGVEEGIIREGLDCL